LQAKIVRALILCELFPLVHGTRALQMAKVAGALADYTARSGSGDDVFVLSGVEQHRQPEARAWLADRDNRACLPYLPERTSSRLAAGAVHVVRIAASKLTRNAPFVRRARDQVRKIVDAVAPDIVMTVTTPLLWHRVGLEIKKDFPSLPWAAFFADPRPLGLLPPPFRRRGPMTAYKAWLCRRVLSRADAVIGPHRYMLDWMEDRLGVSLSGRRYVIPHCGLKAEPDVHAHAYRGWLLHVGTLAAGQVTVDLLKAIRATTHKHPDAFRGLMCVGRVAPSVHKLAASLGMERCVKAIGRVPPDQAAAMVAAADATLLADTPLDIGYFLHSKFADYAVNGRPILMVGPERCPMRDYLRVHGGGLAVSHRQAEIEQALERLFVHNDLPCQTRTPGPSTELTELGRQFSPETIAAKYYEAFHEIVHGAADRRRPAA
jgi:hypothetical protein